jgi:hypothetical protein
MQENVSPNIRSEGFLGVAGRIILKPFLKKSGWDARALGYA